MIVSTQGFQVIADSLNGKGTSPVQAGGGFAGEALTGTLLGFFGNAGASMMEFEQALNQAINDQSAKNAATGALGDGLANAFENLGLTQEQLAQLSPEQLAMLRQNRTAPTLEYELDGPGPVDGDPIKLETNLEPPEDGINPPDAIATLLISPEVQALADRNPAIANKVAEFQRLANIATAEGVEFKGLSLDGSNKPGNAQAAVAEINWQLKELRHSLRPYLQQAVGENLAQSRAGTLELSPALLASLRASNRGGNQSAMGIQQATLPSGERQQVINGAVMEAGKGQTVAVNPTTVATQANPATQIATPGMIDALGKTGMNTERTVLTENKATVNQPATPSAATNTSATSTTNSTPVGFMPATFSVGSETSVAAQSNATSNASGSTPAMAEQVQRVADFLINRTDGVVRMQNGHIEAQFRLQPPTLGDVRVELVMNDQGGARANFIAQTPEAVETLQRHLKHFHEAMSRHGVQVDRASVTLAPRAVAASNPGSQMNGQQGSDQQPANHESARDAWDRRRDSDAQSGQHDRNQAWQQRHQQQAGA